MKKLFTILSAVIITFSVSSQDLEIQAGMNLANLSLMSSNPNSETDMKMGINCGVTAAFSLTDVMTLETGALYSTKGAQSGFDGPKLSIDLSYIELPLNITYSVSDKISLMAGPYVGLLMSANSKISGYDEIYFYEGQEVDMKDDIANMDFGINIGSSFSINESISVGAGYQLGLAIIHSGIQWISDRTNTNIHIEMSYSFGGLM